MPNTDTETKPVPVYRKDGQIHNFHSMQPAYVHSEGEDPRPFDLRDFEDMSGGKRPIPKFAVGQNPDPDEATNREISCLEAMAEAENAMDESGESLPKDGRSVEAMRDLNDQVKAEVAEKVIECSPEQLERLKTQLREITGPTQGRGTVCISETEEE